jgi:hypothetical protein
MGTGIYVAAVITTAVVLVGYGLLAWRLSSPGDRQGLLIAGLIALPLQPAFFVLLRMPIHHALTQLIGTGTLLTVISTFYAPLTEEPAKWIPLAVPPVRRLLRRDSAVPLALAVGLGFGIGEIWLLAYEVAQVPAYAAMPFWMFTGFFVERAYVTFLHGGFVLPVVWCLATGRPFFLGALVGMALHYAVNVPVFLSGIGAFGIAQAGWTMIASLFPLVVAILLGFAMARLSDGRRQMEKPAGQGDG